MELSNCCGAPRITDESDLCSQCKEHCDFEVDSDELDKGKGFDVIIAAMNIFRKYKNPYSPFCCEHDELIVFIDPNKVSVEDTKSLEELGFLANYNNGNFTSSRFGSG